MTLDLYTVTIFDQTGPALFVKRILASSRASAEEIAASLFSGRIESVEFEYEVDAIEGSLS